MTCKYCNVETKSGWDGNTLDICEKCQKIESESKYQSIKQKKSNTGSIKSEMCACACIKCKNQINEIIMYEEGKCNHILHGILTLLTGVWVVVWGIVWVQSKKITENNKRLSALLSKCSECNGSLMVLS